MTTRTLTALRLLAALAATAAPTAIHVTAATAQPQGYTVVWGQAQVTPGPAGQPTCPAGEVAVGGGALVTSYALSAVLVTSWRDDPDVWRTEVRSGTPTWTYRIAVCELAPFGYVDEETSPTAYVRPYSQAGASASCPAWEVPLGGGGGDDLAVAGLNSSVPTASGWHIDDSNATSQVLPFSADAACAYAPHGYAVVHSAPVANPPGTQVGAWVACPAGTVPLGGGAYSTSASPLVTMNSSFPYAGGWEVYENNASTDGALLSSYAVCSA